MRSNALTTLPAGSTSMLSRPPDICVTFLPKSAANSWKMSLVGQVLWKRRLMGAAAGPGEEAGAGAGWSLGAGAGFFSVSLAQPAATAATPAAPTAAFFRKPRRVVVAVGFFMMLSFRQGP